MGAKMNWKNILGLRPRVYKCGHCGEKMSSVLGYHTEEGANEIYICMNCTEPTYFNDAKKTQFPGEVYGDDVKHIPENIEMLYNEARHCFSVQGYTTSVMACRKLLMNIAVQNGEKEGLSFVQYIDFFEKNHFTPPNSRGWVDHIRKKGNEANHEIKIMAKEDAEDLINFIEMILKFIYEFPGRIEKKKSVQPEET